MPQSLRIVLISFALLGILGLIGYAFVRAFRKAVDPVRLAVKWIVTLLGFGAIFYLARGGPFGAIFGVLLAVPIAIVLAFVWAPSIGHTLFSPILSALDGGNEEPDPQPLYSIAEALRRRDRFREAIYAIQEQLNKFPTDFIGQMLLAEIQAENLNELPSAEITIHRLCEQKNHSPANLAFALNTLADWHVKYEQDTEAAKRALEKIVALLPDSEFERTALNRLAHLGSPDVLVKLREAETLELRPGVEYLGLLKDQSHLQRKEKTGLEEAPELVAHLEAHPLDHEARERLAVIYARDFGRLDLATDQLEQLIALPGESPRHVVRWLNLLADLQIDATASTVAAEQTLRRIMELFPNQSFAELTQLRLDSLPLELKRFEQGHVVKFSPSGKV